MSWIDPELSRELWNWLLSHEACTQANTDLKSLAAVATSMLTPSSTSMPYHQVSHYLRRASQALPLIEGLIEAKPDTAAKVLEHGLRQVWVLGCESTDDDPSVPEFATELATVWLRAVGAANPQEDCFGLRLAGLVNDDPWCTLDLRAIEAALDPASRQRWHEHQRLAHHRQR